MVSIDRYRRSLPLATASSSIIDWKDITIFSCIPSNSRLNLSILRNDVRKLLRTICATTNPAIYPPLPHVLRVAHLHPSASYSIVSCSLPSTWHGRLRASLIDGNNAYVIKEIGIRVCVMCTTYRVSLPSFDPPPTHWFRSNQIKYS